MLETEWEIVSENSPIEESLHCPICLHVSVNPPKPLGGPGQPQMAQEPREVGSSGHCCEITKGWKPTTKRLFLRIPQQFITDLAFNWIFFLKSAHECCLPQNSLKLIVPGVDVRSWAEGSKPQKPKSPGLTAHCPISNRGSGRGA